MRSLPYLLSASLFTLAGCNAPPIPTAALSVATPDLNGASGGATAPGVDGQDTLIFIGNYPLIARDILLATERIPVENLVKARTLGASRPGVRRSCDAPGAWFTLITPRFQPSTPPAGAAPAPLSNTPI